MEEEIKIYDTVRANQLLYYNRNYSTTNSTKMKKNSNHWTNIFTWKKKAKQTPNSILNYPFSPNHKYSSMSAATGIAYAFAPPPGRVPPPTPTVTSYATPDLNYITATTTTTTIHASIRHNPGNRQMHNRSSLFYSPWETFHDHSANHMPNECTCSSSDPLVADTYCSKKEIKSLNGQSSKTVPMIGSADEPLYVSRRMSRMDLYSVDEENSCTQKPHEFRSKSSDSLLDIKKSSQTSNGLKSCRSSTTLNSSPFTLKSRSKEPNSATVNERFLRLFKRTSSTDSIASRKSILECDVSAYDLIKQNLELIEDDDSLSDNAIENDTNCEVVGIAPNRKSFSFDSHLNETDMKQKSTSERRSIINKSVRIGGYGMLLGQPTPKNKHKNKSVRDCFNSDSNYGKISITSWSDSPPNHSIIEPEPDYDSYSDDNSENESYISNQKLKNASNGLNSNTTPILDVRENDEKIFEREELTHFENKSVEQNNKSDINHNFKDKRIEDSVINNEPPSPPPEPPLMPPVMPLTTNCLNRNLVLSKVNSNSPNISAYQCELKDKLTSGVRSILKKSRTQNKSIQLSRDHSISKSETNLSASTDSCDYLRTFKEFKESRLRTNIRHRKHVHFKSQSHDRLLIDEIASQTIPEVEESDEPIYDDVRLPTLNGSASDDELGPSGDPTINDIKNDFHKLEQLNSILESITSDNTTIKIVTNDDPIKTKTTQRTGPLEFAEFDPSEDLSQSSSKSTAIRAQPSVSTKSQYCHNRVDLRTKPNSLTESHSNCITNDKQNHKNCNDLNTKILTQEMRGTPDSPKNSFPSPAANTITEQSFNIVADLKNDSKILTVQRKCLQIVNTDSVDRTPVAKPRDDKQQGKHSNCQTTDIKGPVAQSRAHKSLNISNVNTILSSDKSHVSSKEKEIIETIADKNDKNCKEIIQTLLPVSQKCSDISNYDQNNKNSVQLYDTNAVRLENNFMKNNNNNNNTEIQVFNCNQIKTLETEENALENNSISYGIYQSTYGGPKSSLDERVENRVNPYLCTISIKDESNDRIINETSFHSNLVNNVCVSGTSIPFESMDSSHSSSSFYDCGANSSIDSLSNDRSLKSFTDIPINILCANSDKIVINVPSDNNFDNINEHIYEELDTESIYVDTDSSLENVKSIFDGASKDEILEFLEDAKERVGEDILVDTTTIDTNIEILEAIDVIQEITTTPILSTTNRIETSVQSSSRRNRTSNVSNSSTDSSATTSSSIDIEEDILKCAITNSSSVGQLVERNDSGVGAETSKPSRHRKLSLNDEVEHQCADCEMHVDPNEDDETGLLHYPLFCHRCDKKRSERKEIISEIVDTEFKYGRDLRIIREEFYRPIEIAGLLSKEQLRGVFLNLDELISVNSKFSEKLQDAIDIATEQGDEDFTTVNIGKIFRDSSSMLHTFEVYCVRQGSAALLLNHLEKEKELLRIFLRVSQMENTLLRRMNLRSFLVVPVQRVTKYPLLLNRLYKVTPYHHRDREALRESQQKVELHLEHINQQTKGTIGATTRIWRRISNLSTSHRRLNNADDIGNIKLRKAALEILKWNQEETQFVIIGKVFFTSITDYTVNRKTKTIKFLTASALLATLGRPNQNYRPDLVHSSDSDKNMVFPRDNTGISDAVLLLIKEKCGRYALCKEILNLKSCVISTEVESGDEMFEIHEQILKESLLLKAETVSETKDWLKQLKYHSKDLGNWRRRRHALANIMMVRQ